MYDGRDADDIDAKVCSTTRIRSHGVPSPYGGCSGAVQGGVGEVQVSGPSGVPTGLLREAASINNSINNKYSICATIDTCNNGNDIVSTAGPTPFLGGPDVPGGAYGSPGRQTGPDR